MATLYPLGNYGVKFTAQGFDESNGKPYFFLEFKPYIQMGTNTPVEVQYPERKRFYLVGGGVAVSIEQLKNLGWPGGDPTTLDPDNPNGFSFVGKEAVLYNKHRNGQAKEDGTVPQYNDWNVPRAGGEGGSKYGESHKSGLSKKLQAAFAKAQGGSAAPAGVAPSAPISDDDIPF